jgi:predicted Zn-dependent peptidase
LFTELREERGLCYQVGSELSLFEETGALQILAGLDPESREESLKTLFKETEDLARNGPRPGELERAKRLAIAQSKLGFESTSAHCAWVGEGLLFFGHIPTPQQARENLLNVTDAEVQAVARTLFAQKPAIAEIRA